MVKHTLERRQAEENNEAPAPVILENNIAARIGILNIEENKKSAEQGRYMFSRPIIALDPWNFRHCKRVIDEKLADMDERRYRQHPCLEAEHLRKMRPEYIPVIVEKDPRSDIPDIDAKKYHVHGEMVLGEFVYSIRVMIRFSRERPIYAFFKNIQFPAGALMSAIYKENMDEDGYLHMTYSGRANVCSSNRDRSRIIIEENKKSPEQGSYTSSKSIITVDPWNCRNFPRLLTALADHPCQTELVENMQRSELRTYENIPCLEVGNLKKKHPDHIPVNVEKDASSDIPDIDAKKYLVHGEMALAEFIDFIRIRINLNRERPIFVSFRNTQFPDSILMSTIYEKYAGEDRYLHMSYSGEAKG